MAIWTYLIASSFAGVVVFLILYYNRKKTSTEIGQEDQFAAENAGYIHLPEPTEEIPSVKQAPGMTRNERRLYAKLHKQALAKGIVRGGIIK